MRRSILVIALAMQLLIASAAPALAAVKSGWIECNPSYNNPITWSYGVTGWHTHSLSTGGTLGPIYTNSMRVGWIPPLGTYTIWYPGGNALAYCGN